MNHKETTPIDTFFLLSDLIIWTVATILGWLIWSLITWSHPTLEYLFVSAVGVAVGIAAKHIFFD